jgi:polar amino acid transport system substrate-binding protein
MKRNARMRHPRFLILLLLILPAFASADTLSRLRSTGVMNIGFIPKQRPFSFDAGNLEPNGYAVELCEEIWLALKARQGLPDLKLSYVPTSALAGLDLIGSGRIDLLCGAVTETIKAREVVSFSIPIYVSGIGAMVRKDAPASLLRALNGEVPHTGPTWRATVNAGLSNHTYAVHAQTTSEAAVRARVASSGVIAKVVSVQTYEEGVKLVQDGKASAFFADRVVLTNYASRQVEAGSLIVLDRRFTLEPVALALQRGDEPFRLAVDAALSDLYRSGKYLGIYARYFGDPSETVRMLFQAYALP